MEASDDKARQQKVIAGGFILVVAVAIGIYAATSGRGTTACSLGASGVGLITDGLSKNKSAGVIAAEVAGSYALSEGCKKAINTFVAEPDKQVRLKIDTTSGATQQQTSGSELAQPPPTQPSTGDRALDCLRWRSNFLYQLCVDGTIDPPANP